MTVGELARAKADSYAGVAFHPTRSWPNDYVWIPNYTGRSTDEAMLARIADSQEAE